MIEEFWHLRTVLAKPRFLPVVRGAALEDFVAERRELVHVPWALNREAQHADAAVNRGSCRAFVLPRHVVSRARREHGDLVTSDQAMGQIAAVGLGAAGDVGTVSLNDEGQLHRGVF